MIQITATDLKMNLGKYLKMAQDEEIHITKNGENVAILTAPKAARKKSGLEALIGIIPDEGLTLDDYKMERLRKHL